MTQIHVASRLKGDIMLSFRFLVSFWVTSRTGLHALMVRGHIRFLIWSSAAALELECQYETVTAFAQPHHTIPKDKPLVTACHHMYQQSGFLFQNHKLHKSFKETFTHFAFIFGLITTLAKIMAHLFHLYFPAEHNLYRGHTHTHRWTNVSFLSLLCTATFYAKCWLARCKLMTLADK